MRIRTAECIVSSKKLEIAPAGKFAFPEPERKAILVEIIRDLSVFLTPSRSAYWPPGGKKVFVIN